MTAPRLDTGRLALVPVTSDDRARLLAHWGQPAVARWLFDGHAPTNDAVARLVEASRAAEREHRYGLWTIYAADRGAFLGVCGIRSGADGPELLYSLEPDARGRGYALEASLAVLDHCFGALALPRVLASVDAPNLDSVAVLERLGFTARPPRLLDAQHLYALDASAWRSRAATKSPLDAAAQRAQVWYAGTSREILGRAICDVGGRARVGVGLLELPPGSDTRPAHWHTREEEHLYALDGRATLHLGDQRFVLAAGSYVCFPAGAPRPHYLHNEGDVPFRYLMIGERIEDDVVIYSSR